MSLRKSTQQHNQTKEVIMIPEWTPDDVEVLFVAPELKNIVHQTSDLFDWQSKDCPYRRINYLTVDDCLRCDALLKKIRLYQTAGFGVIILFDSLEGPLLNNLLSFDENEIKPVSILDMELSRDELWSMLYHPSREFTDLIRLGEFKLLHDVINTTPPCAHDPIKNALREWAEWAVEEWEFF